MRAAALTRAPSFAVWLVAAWLAGCATTPPPPVEEDYEPALEQPAYTPMVEYPPIEPVEPPPTAPEPTPSAAMPSERAPTIVASIPPPPVQIIIPEPTVDELQMNLLLADLQRYGNMPNDDARRELATMSQVLTRQRTDANRVRLAVLYTIARTNPQDDQRALQLLENVAKSGSGAPAVKQLASVLQVQISDRVRSVRDEQVKTDAAMQKLEALRNMERSLLRERVRGGGGGGGGSGGSSGGGGGGGGGGGSGAGGG